MKARFNIERERTNKIFLRSYRNDYCLFQFHSQIELYFVDEGEMEMLVAGQSATLTAGDISVALGFDTHAYKTPNSSRSRVLLIPQYMAEQFTRATAGRRFESPFIRSGALADELRGYLTAIQNGGIGNVKQNGYIQLILGALLDNLTLVESDRLGDTELASRILFYIDENYMNRITPATVASHFGYNQSYISRYFKSSFGITLGEYINAVRLRSAARLIGEGRHDITYCAMESGFSSMRTFYRAFLAEFGTSPKEYLKDIKEQ